MAPAFVHQDKTYSDVLPTLAANYEFIPSHSTYVDFTKNFRAPQNYALFDTIPQTEVQKAETSYNYDLGYRFQTDRYIVQASLFWVDFYNRIATRDRSQHQCLDRQQRRRDPDQGRRIAIGREGDRRTQPVRIVHLQ